MDDGDPPCWDRSTTEEEDDAKGLGPDDALPRNWWNIYEYPLPAIACMGIDKNTTVAVCAGNVSVAARVVRTLMYAGVEDVRLLDGGENDRTGAGYDLETAPGIRIAAVRFLIKTGDNRRGRLFVFDKGRVSAAAPENASL